MSTSNINPTYKSKNLVNQDVLFPERKSLEEPSLFSTLIAAANKTQESPEKIAVSPSRIKKNGSSDKTHTRPQTLFDRLQGAADEINSPSNYPTKHSSSSSSYNDMPSYSLPKPIGFQESDDEVAHFSNSPQKRSFNKVSSSQITPEAPRKKRAGISRINQGTPSEPSSPFVAFYEKAIDRLKVSYQGQEFKVVKFAQPGTYVQAFRIVDEKPLMDGKKNDSLLFKLFHTVGTYKKNYQEIAIQHSLENYFFLKEKGINVATIYNTDTLAIDKAYVVELIPHPVDVNNPQHLEAANVLFHRFFEESIPMDLCYTNLRVNESGVVTLIDFLEEPLSFEKKSKIRDYTTQFLKSWVLAYKTTLLESSLSGLERKAAAEIFLKNLTKGLSDYIPQDWIDGALDEHFMILM